MKKLLVALVLALLAPLAASAQATDWSAPVEIDTETRSNWFPSVAADPWGAPHMVWSSGDGEGEQSRDFLMYSQKQGDAWATANDIVFTGTGGWAARNSLAIDRSGRLHLLVRSRDHIFYTSSSPDGASSAHGWKEPHIINGIGMPYYSSIAIDQAGLIHVVYQEMSPRTPDDACEGCSDVWYRRSTDRGESWSAPMNISNGEHGAIKVQLIVDALNNLYVSWDEGKDPNSSTGEPIGIAYAVSRDQGVSWEPAQRLRLPDGVAAEQSTLGVTGSGQLVQVFRSTPGDQILYRYSNDNGAGWTDPQPIPGWWARDRNETPWDKYAMATDSAGNIHLLAVLRRAPDADAAELVHLRWDGSNEWQPQQTLVADSKLRPEWPQLVVAEGNRLHATWFTRNADDLYLSDTTAAYKVWYSTSSVDAPAQTVEVEPTPTALPQPTPTAPPAVEQPDAALAEAAVQAAPPQPVKSEAPLLRLLGLALAVPAALFGMVAILVIRKRLG